MDSTNENLPYTNQENQAICTCTTIRKYWYYYHCNVNWPMHFLTLAEIFYTNIICHFLRTLEVLGEKNIDKFKHLFIGFSNHKYVTSSKMLNISWI